jgi:hypothetical protein
MNYKKIYDNLILSRSKLARNKYDGIFEKHHIIPRCLGGSNKKENLILLTPKEHLFAHLLLSKIYTGKEKSKMSFALLMMCNRNKSIVSSRQYETARKLVRDLMSGKNHYFYGKRLTKETREKMSKAHLGIEKSEVHKSNISKGRKGIIFSDKHKLNISKSHKGKIPSEKTREKMSESSRGENNYFYGKKFSENHKEKISKSLTGRKLTDEQKRKIGEAGRKTSNRKSVDQYDLDGNLIKRWSNFKDILRDLGISNSSICQARRIGGKAGGFIWKYVDK